MDVHVKEQYKTAQNLNTRISIHEKYSVNKQPFGEWIMSHYEIASGDRILEVGCGTAQMWQGNLGLLPFDSHLCLSDFSQGMLEAAKSNLGNHPQLEYRMIDIQSIPFSDNSFDIVIVNMMLYHVPDLHKGLSEVRRVCRQKADHGILYVPKEYGMFICK